MARTIVIKSKHKLGVEKAKENVAERYEALRRQYGHIMDSDLSWDGPVGHMKATAFGQTGTADFHVEEERVVIDITLPWLLAGFSGLIKKFLDSQEDTLKPELAGTLELPPEVKLFDKSGLPGGPAKGS